MTEPHEHRGVPYHPVADRIDITPALDPLWLIVFAFLFAGVALLTIKRAGFGAAALVAVVPFFGSHAFLGTTVTAPKVVLLAVIVGLSNRAEAWRVLRRRPVALVIAAFCAIILVNVLTLAVAQHRSDVLRESFKWLEYLAVFCTLVVAYAADPAARLVRTALFLSILAVALSALWEIVSPAPSGMWIGDVAIPRIAGVLDGPNQLGGYLEVAVAALGAWQMREPNRLTAATLLLSSIALGLTFSRAAFGGALLILAIFAIVERRTVLRLWPLGLGLAGAFAADLARIAVIDGLPAADRSLLEHASDTNASLAGGVGNRAELWRAALFFFRSHPLLGIGAGNYELELSQAGLYGVRTQANSWYLQALAEGGIALFAATVAWIAAVLASLARTLRTSPWGLAAFAASCALVAHGFFDDLVFYPKVAEAWIALIALGVTAVI